MHDLMKQSSLSLIMLRINLQRTLVAMIKSDNMTVEQYQDLYDRDMNFLLMIIPKQFEKNIIVYKHLSIVICIVTYVYI